VVAQGIPGPERPRATDDFRPRRRSDDHMAPVGLTIRGPLRREDLPGLYARVCGRLAELPAGDVACGVTGLGADAVALEALARLQLAARGQGRRVLLVGASPALLDLVDLTGLTEVLLSPRAAQGGRTARRAARARGRTSSA
jgi:ABC-type transporter Mla MlaB component